MNTGFLGPAVATVLTACGIETSLPLPTLDRIPRTLQQYLPLAVLKQSSFIRATSRLTVVATVLTACGIET